MSEEVINKATAEGAFVVGGVGGVINPASGVGNAPVANYGQFGTPTSVNPTGGEHSMLLPPQQAGAFIQYIWDGTVLAKEGRRITMSGNTVEVSKVNVGERLLRGANQADGDYINAGAKFSKIELTTKKLRLDWEFSSEMLEDNIMGADFEDYIVRLMTNQIGNDIEDLAVNGVGDNVDPFLGMMEGFVHRARGAGGGHEVKQTTPTPAITEWTPDTLQTLINALPRRYRALKHGYKFYTGSRTFANIVRNNGVLPGNTSTSNNTQNWLDGQGQVLGQAGVQTRALGIPVVEVPYYPDDYVELTFPENRIWGIQRDIKINREYKPKKDTTEWTVFLRFGIAWEELDAMAWADAGQD